MRGLSDRQASAESLPMEPSGSRASVTSGISMNCMVSVV